MEESTSKAEVKTMERIKEYMRGWLNYYSMADMKKQRPAEHLAVSKDTNVYLETVETAKDTKTEADGVGNARMGSL